MNDDGAAEDLSLPVSWHVRPSTRRANVVVTFASMAGALVSVLWVMLGSGPDHVSAAGISMLGSAAIAVAAWRLGLHPRVTATSRRLIVVNPVSSVRIRWSDIAAVQPGYAGITIARVSGPPVSAWAIQESNLASWLGRETRAQQIANELSALAARLGGINEQDPANASRRASIHAELEPSDAVRNPLSFPWRMTRIESACLGFTRLPNSPVGALLSGIFWLAFAVIFVVLAGSEAQDMALLDRRGTEVTATVTEMYGDPEDDGRSRVAWPGLPADEEVVVDGAQRVGTQFSVVFDPAHPSRARRTDDLSRLPLAGMSIAATVGVLLTTGTFKWARWLNVRPAIS